MAHRDRVRELLDEHGTTYAEQAGIRLKDTPAPLYQLLVLATLLSARIRADIAVAAARELFQRGWRTPAAMLDSTWRQRVDALGAGGYARYDESTARYLVDGARFCVAEYRGDLRRMHSAARDPAALRARLTDFTGIGPTGARIYCREVQAVWPDLRPYFDQRALTAAARAGLPTDPARLAELAPRGDCARLAAALVRSGAGRRRSG